MGNKIITEKDFWTCTGGLMPAPMQTHQRSTKKEKGTFHYVTIEDTATSSVIDFGCKKLMLVLALLAIAIALVTVATGGMALVAICVAAAAVGTAVGAIVGSLICGQLGAAARYWMQSKSNLIIQGHQAITGDDKMQCMIFGDIISFAPQIKNWWQAIALGASNFIGELLQNMMYGAAIGSGAAILTGGPAVLAEFGLSNVGANWLATFTTGSGLGLRGIMAAQGILKAYGESGNVTFGQAVSSAFAMEIGTAQAAGHILSGHGTMNDFLGVAMWMLPAPKGARGTNEEGRTNEENQGEENKNEENNEEESSQAKANESEAPKQEGEFEAFEDSPGTKPTDQALIDAVEAEAVSRIEKFSNAKNGPCLTGVRDPITGEVFFGENFGKNQAGREAYNQFVENAHPLLKERINARQEQINEGKANNDPLFEKVDTRAGDHSEIVALDKALKAREAATGKPVTEADLSSFDLHNRHLPNNNAMHRCPNCGQITNGVNIVGGHK